MLISISILIYLKFAENVGLQNKVMQSMEGRKGHNSVLLFKLQFKHLYIRIYYFCFFYYSYFIFTILPL